LIFRHFSYDAIIAAAADCCPPRFATFRHCRC
jgi:hypothetical protein